MDALLDSYGGAKEISEKIDSMRDYETRKRIAGEKGYGEMLEKADGYANNFAKVEDFVAKNGITVTKQGICTTQVSGFQAARPTFDCLKRVAENRDVLYHKCLRCDKDAKEIMRRGHETKFARVSCRK